MALSDSMFLFEIVVEDFKKFVRCKEVTIRSHFEDVFTLNLSQGSDESYQHKRKMIKPKLKLRNTKSNLKSSSKTQLQSGHLLLLANNIEWLISHMSLHPLEVSLWNKKNPEKKLGGARIPWSKPYKDYLNKLSSNQNLPPVIVNGKYNIINESLSKCIASIALSIKLRYLQGSHNTTALSNDNELNEMAAINKIRSDDIVEINKCPCRNDTSVGISHLLQCNPMSNNVESKYVQLKENSKDSSLLRVVKSDTKLSKRSSEMILRSRSLSSIDIKSNINPLTYIFGCPRGKFGNRIYCVSYFTVDNDVSGNSESPKESIKELDRPLSISDQPLNISDQPTGRYHFKICDSQCPMKKEYTGSCSQSVCSLDLPEEASHLISVTKCKQVECDSKQQRVPSSAPDDRILLDLTNLNAQCCDFTETIEEVVGGVKGKLQIGDDPCFCACECTFGFTKKTTYCTVCGGYEIVGEELVPTVDNQAPFPCPLFHKLIDKSKLKNWSTSGSESKKKGDDQSVKSMKGSSGQKAAATTKRQAVTKSVESEKDTKKGTKKKKDDRFKFNYGYKGIPPQIGHSECAMPCSGTLGNVPKNMGWLWTAEDVPGMKVKYGWRPGAISKRLLRALNKAKLRRSVIEQKQTKKSKKRVEDKPTLVISSKGGEYRIEMNVPSNSNGAECTPLVYTIDSENNKAKIKKKERKQKRMIRAAIDETWSDPYNPENCENICLPAYYRAIGVNHDKVSKDSEEVDVLSSCSDEDIRSSCSSSDIDWELQFSPPSALRQEIAPEIV